MEREIGTAECGAMELVECKKLTAARVWVPKVPVKQWLIFSVILSVQDERGY